jgi:hypothetical protein
MSLKMTQTIQLFLRPKRTTMNVTLHEPLNQNDECPILQDPIATAHLDTFPYPFLAQQPTYTAMTLQCKHTFHAMALTYYWARSGTVQCPVCRSGPGKGQCLALNRLPTEWKYSMAARIRRERKQDRMEEEQANRRLAVQHSMVVVPAFELEIRIEAHIGASPSSWTLKTKLVELQNVIIFDVPAEELQKIPYTPDTLIRLIPFTRMHVLQASDWFRIGINPGSNFSVGYHTEGFMHIHLAMRDDLFATLVSDLIVGRLFGGGDGFQLLMLSDQQ